MNRIAAAIMWSSTKRITGALLALWLLVNLLGPWFARDLARLMGDDSPFGFWLAAEVALLLYLAIIVVYAVAMDRIERRYLDDQKQAEDAQGAGSK
jgi:putative solute:sodium symporter small subunit